MAFSYRINFDGFFKESALMAFFLQLESVLWQSAGLKIVTTSYYLLLTFFLTEEGRINHHNSLRNGNVHVKIEGLL